MQSAEQPTRTCLVVGAGRGIGAALADRLLELGHRVAVASRTAPVRTGGAGARTMSIAADVTRVADVDAMFERVEQTWGAVEVLVLSAGAAPSAALTETTDDMWRAAQATNLDGPFFCMRRGLPAMTSADWGRVVVVASVNSKRGEPFTAAYSSSKHGVLGLVRVAAAELARTGVTVNAICPSYVATPMTEQSIAAIADRRGWDKAEALERLLRGQPNRRLIETAEVVTALEFCLASPSVNGQGINVDGGLVQS